MSKYEFGRRSTPTSEEQRRLFDEWYNSEQHQAYLAAIEDGGATPWTTNIEEAFELFRRRWAYSRKAE